MKNRFVQRTALIVVFSLVPFAVTAAGTSEPVINPITITDALGRSVVLSAQPKRILLAGKAVLFTTNTAYLFPEASVRVIGTGSTNQGLGDMFPILDAGSSEKARFANNVGPEQLVTANPDVVILKTYLRDTLGQGVEKLGIPVLYIDLETPDAFYDDIKMMGDLFDNPKRAGDIVSYYQQREEMVQGRTADVDGPRVLLVSYSQNDGGVAFSVPSNTWIQTTMIEDAGGVAVWKEGHVGGGWKKVNLEQIAVWAPEIIFVVSYRTDLEDRMVELAGSNSLGITGARVLPFPADYYSWDQPDPRWILGLLFTAKVLHPSLFTDLDMDAEIENFFGYLYGLDQSEIAANIVPRISASVAAAR